MRLMLLTALFAGTVSFTAAQAPPKKEPTLKVGDAAPALKADKWLQGAEVPVFEADKVYVVEFWATWCGPCIIMMPHMADMQEHFKGQGVTFIGFSARDQGDNPTNNLDSVSAFVKKRGPKLGYTFCYADDRKTYDAWMTAAGQNGIPCSYVVDKAGKIAWIGHPMMLDFVLPKIVAGKWTDDDVIEVEKIDKEVSAVFQAMSNKDPEVTLKAMADLTKAHPWTANIPYFVVPRIAKLAAAKKVDEACQEAKSVLAKAVSRDDTSILMSLAFSLRTPELREHKDLTAVALQAAEANLKVQGNEDFNALYNAAETHFAVGDKGKALAYAEQSIPQAKTTFQVANLIRNTNFKDNKALMEKVLATAEAREKTEKPLMLVNALINVAEAHKALGNNDKIQAVCERMIAAATTTAQLSSVVNYAGIKEHKDLLPKLLKAAEGLLAKASEPDSVALINVAEAHYLLGDKDKAKEFGAKAVDAAKPNQKRMIEARVKKYGG